MSATVNRFLSVPTESKPEPFHVSPWIIIEDDSNAHGCFAGGGAVDHRRHAGDTLPEPVTDIAAQLRAMLSPHSTKDAVFIAKANEKDIPRVAGIYRVRRAEGTLLTTNRAKAQFFRTRAKITDEDLAALLGYPESKREVIARAKSGEPAGVVQARDSTGNNVISEAVASASAIPRTISALSKHAPNVRVVSPQETALRRIHLLQQHALTRGWR